MIKKVISNARWSIYDVWIAKTPIEYQTEIAQNTEERKIEFLYAKIMNKELRIFQTNMKKSREVQHALHNDIALENFHFILG